MARLPALIAAITRTWDDLEHSAAVNVADLLRADRLIAPSKRGVGAAEMTVTDAANLLLGLAAPARPLRCVASVLRFRALKSDARSEMADAVLPAAVLGAEDFGDAIAALIEHAGRIADAWDQAIAGRVAHWDMQRDAMPAGTRHAPLALSVDLDSAPWATIRVDSTLGGTRQILTELRYTVDADLMLRGGYGRVGSGHKSHATRFDLAVFVALHRALAA